MNFAHSGLFFQRKGKTAEQQSAVPREVVDQDMNKDAAQYTSSRAMTVFTNLA